MIILLNLLPYLFLAFMALVIYFAVPSKTGKIVMSVITALCLVLITTLQPSYFPKGTVQPPVVVEFKVIDAPMTDRILKPKSAEQYDLERNKALEKINDSINEQILKQTKEK